MKLTSLLVLALIFYSCLKENSIPEDFVKEYYAAYGGVPTAEKLAPFYHDSVTIEDPTYDWVGKSEIFENFTANNARNEYDWRVDQVITMGNRLVTEGLLKAKYGGIPYEMRFVNIFYFQEGKIIRQYDYFDNQAWYKAVEVWKKQNPDN